MGSATSWSADSAAPYKPFEFTAQEGERLLRIVSESLSIKTHCDLYVWLNGEMREFLPHQVLISAWGDYETRSIDVDVTSSLPGVRTAQTAQCRLEDVVMPCYATWVAAGRRPLLYESQEALLAAGACTCAVHRAVREMRSVLVHGVRDGRNGDETLYIALDSGEFFRNASRERFLALAHLLIGQLDLALRKVAAYPANGADGAPIDLSSREHEILACIRGGKTNFDIAEALKISHYTVKNHVRRIFKKLRVTNRTSAAAKSRALLRVVKPR